MFKNLFLCFWPWKRKNIPLATWRNDVQQNDIQQNDRQHNQILKNDANHNSIKIAIANRTWVSIRQSILLRAQWRSSESLGASICIKKTIKPFFKYQNGQKLFFSTLTFKMRYVEFAQIAEITFLQKLNFW